LGLEPAQHEAEAAPAVFFASAAVSDEGRRQQPLF
jgi:hypothetical protein